MQISDAGIELIQEFEGLRLVGYRCPAGKATVGYGHTKKARVGQRISMERAEQLLREDLDTFEQCVDRVVSVPLNSNEFSALVSWAFNVGCGAVAKSTLVRKLNAGDRAGAAN
jgi:lysozyme